MIQINLTRIGHRTLFLVTVIALSGSLTFLSGKAYLAEHWNASSNPKLWLKAARLEPGNAKYWEHLGLYKQWSLGPAANRQAVRFLKRATHTDPWSADLWMELADAYQTSGDRAHAQEAYKKAQADYAISPEVAWRYASFLLYEGDYSRGYAEIRRAVAVDPSLATKAIEECWQSNPSVGPILDEVLPTHSEYYFQAIDFFLSKNQPAPALAVWNRALAISLPIQMHATLPLVDALIDQGRVSEAQQTWHQLLSAAKWPRNPSNSTSLVFNGRFEHDIANGGFGWREVPVSGARFDYDHDVAHSGSRSLRIEFDGSVNLDFQNVFQYVAVAPKTRYHFSAYLRTEAISTDSGIRFEIVDPRHPSELQIVTPNLIGTVPWTLVQADVSTGPDTNILKIDIRRIPSWKFDNKLSGTVWVDNVRLTPDGTRPKDHTRWQQSE